MKLSQLQAFVTVVEHGNFSSAALELGVSQSTVSHAIATLEAELGIVLLVRGRHGAALTPEGEQVIHDARSMLQLQSSIQTKANLLKDFKAGQVRIASVRSITTHVLPEVIARFRRKFPNIKVTIAEFDRYIEAEQALRDGQVDIGFTFLPTSPEFEAWELLRDQFVALLPPHALDPESALTWEELICYPMIINHRSYFHNKLIQEHLCQFGYQLQIGYEVREDSTITSMIREGLGASIMARLAAEPIPEDILVRNLPVPLERVIGAAILADALLPRAVFVFLDVLKEGTQGC
ncbi:MAG: LysR family transcriptional regulator [Elainellaceae cyanobacterium]